MKAKLGTSGLVDERKYVGKLLVIFGIFMAGAALTVAFPALKFLALKLFI